MLERRPERVDRRKRRRKGTGRRGDAARAPSPCRPCSVGPTRMREARAGMGTPAATCPSRGPPRANENGERTGACVPRPRSFAASSCSCNSVASLLARVPRGSEQSVQGLGPCCGIRRVRASIITGPSCDSSLERTIRRSSPHDRRSRATKRTLGGSSDIEPCFLRLSFDRPCSVVEAWAYRPVRSNDRSEGRMLLETSNALPRTQSKASVALSPGGGLSGLQTRLPPSPQGV